MNTNSNTYTVIYATVLVVVVAAVLAYVSFTLAPAQEANRQNEVRTQLLASVGIQDVKNAKEAYDKYFTESFLVNSLGEKVDGDAFAVAMNLKGQNDKIRVGRPEDATLPVFICTFDDGSKAQVFAAYGAGLWGPIWGYISVDAADMNTVKGAVFDHKGETPGLGAEIAQPWFRENFVGKKIFEGEEFTSVKVVKGGAAADDTHGVDAITGGTITSRALENTLAKWLGIYLPYIQAQKSQVSSCCAHECCGHCGDACACEGEGEGDACGNCCEAADSACCHSAEGGCCGKCKTENSEEVK